MKKVLLIILTLGVINCYAQETIKFAPYWLKGEKHSYSCSDIKAKIKGDSLVKCDTTTSVIHLEVMEVNAEHYIIKMTQDMEDILFSEFLDSSILAKIPEEYANLDVIYSITREGEYEQIVNVDELSQMVTTLCDSIFMPLYEDNTLLMTTFNALKQMFSSADYIDQKFYPELRLIHFLYGAEMVDGEVYMYKDVLPNLIGGNPINADTQLYIDTLYTDQSLCIVKRVATINEKEAKNLVVQVFKSMGFYNKKVKKETKNMRINISDDYTFHYNMLFNLPYTISAKRYVNAITSDVEGTFMETLIQLIE